MDNQFLQLIMTKNDSTVSLHDRLEESKKNIEDSVTESSIVNDSYGNSLTATGSDDKAKSFTNYGFSNDTLNWTLWMALYNDSWIFRTAIDKPARDEIRCGIRINNELEDKDDIIDFYTKYSFDLIELLKWGALFGGSIGVCLFDTLEDADYKKPLKENIDKIKKYKYMRMYTVDRWYGVAPSTDTVKSMKSLDFGKPVYYDVTFADGHSIRVHHDYVLRYEHRSAPKLIKNGMLQGWGYAEGCHIINELSRDDQLKSDITSLVNKSLLEVIKMSGMRGVFMGSTDSENEEQMRKRLEMVNWGRNFNSLTFLDKDDEYQANEFSGLSGLSDLLAQNMWLVSAALEMQGILYGDLKGGLSQESDDYERYSQTIHSRCEDYVRPVVHKLLWIYYNAKGIEQNIKFEFNMLAKKKEDKDKMEAMSNFIDICSKLLQDGVIDTKKYAQSLQTYTQKGVVDFTFTDKELDELEDKFEEEMENIDLDEELNNEMEENENPFDKKNDKKEEIKIKGIKN